VPGAQSRWVVGAEAAGTRLDKFLAADGRLGSRPRAASAIERGKVFLNEREAGRTDAGTRLSAGDVVRVWMDRPGSARARARPVESDALRILHEDEAILVLDKPAGLLAVPLEIRSQAPSLYGVLEEHLRSRGTRRPFVVHRIDRDTSGLVLFAKDAGSQARLKEQFRRREPERVYLAVVYGHPDPAAGTWRDHLVWDERALIQKAAHARDPLAREAISQYRVVETFPDASLVEVSLVTGKRNQIRIQARLRGHTLVGEERYVYGPEALRPLTFARQALHAWKLAFRHPGDGRLLRFEAPLPPDMEKLIARLRKQA
jgi:23S rRNA pseudouridine1911/1915/1917 synthase